MVAKSSLLLAAVVICVWMICNIFLDVKISRFISDEMLTSRGQRHILLPKENVKSAELRSTKEGSEFQTNSSQLHKRNIVDIIKFLKTPSLFISMKNCEAKTCYIKTQKKMIIFVKSIANHFVVRKIIRHTWASFSYIKGWSFKTVFVVGKSNETVENLLQLEHEEYNDILQIDIADSYRNLVFKTLASLKWANDNLGESFLFTSADDDVYIQLNRAAAVLDTFTLKTKSNIIPMFSIICMYKLWKKNGKPRRDPKDKNYVSHQQYRPLFWPAFCPGGMYTFESKVARLLLQAAQQNEVLPVDDVWITGVLRQKVGISDDLVIEARPHVAYHIEGYKDVGSLVARLRLKWIRHKTALDNSSICYC